MFVFDSTARPLILLDANAIRYCFTGGRLSTADLEKLRKVMQELARLDLVRFVFTEVVAWELTAVYVDDEDVAGYEALIDFYVPLTATWGLVPSPGRKKLELTLGRRLRHSEAFLHSRRPEGSSALQGCDRNRQDIRESAGPQRRGASRGGGQAARRCGRLESCAPRMEGGAPCGRGSELEARSPRIHRMGDRT